MQDYQAYYLYPANLFVDSRPYLITTVLGSCVAVCLYDTHRHIGGMNHFMLPLWNGEGLASPKYGNVAMKHLVNKMQEQGSHQRNLVAKVFGGAAVLDLENNLFSIGLRNIQVAEQELIRLDIKILASSTGGTYGRKIIFDTYSGEVRQKYIKKTNKINGENR